MMKAVKISLAVLIGCGALLLVLGLIIWIGHSERLIAVHVAIGIALVVTLWTICVLAARTGVPAGAVAFAAAWGGLIVALGLAQEELLTGSWHWTIQVLHVVISMGAIWWGRRLVLLIGQVQPAAGSPRPVVSSAINASGTGST